MKSILTCAGAGAAILALAMLAGNASAAELPKDANTTCPVMTKKDVDPELFVDYKGERIYLCCVKCKKRFAQDPEKYLALVRSEDSATTSGKAAPSPKK